MKFPPVLINSDEYCDLIVPTWTTIRSSRGRAGPTLSTIDYQSVMAVEPNDDAITIESNGNGAEGPDERLIRAAIAGARKGEMDAVRLLYVCYTAEVLTAIKGIVRDSHEAEDIAQEVFIKLISVIEQYTPREGVPFGAWIRRVARNCAYDHLRSRRAQPCDELELHCEHGQTEHERRRDICRAFASLP